MVFFGIFTAITALLATIFYFLNDKFNYWKNAGIPHPKPSFPMGSMKGIGTEKNIFEMIDENYRKFKGKTLFYGIYFLMKPLAGLL